MYKLEQEETNILSAFENNDLKETKNMHQEIKKHRQHAHAFLKKNKQINIRISQMDLDGIKKKSIQMGIPYQTLISSLIHRYVIGNIL